MSRRLTGDPLPKIVPVWFNSVSKTEYVVANKDQPPKLIRPGGRIHPGYIDDQALVFTRYLLPDTYGCPRFRFSRLRENESRNEKAAQKNPLIDSYYPILDCDNSEDQESQKTYSELPNIKKSANRERLNNESVPNVQSLKTPIDSRTFTIYSCKSSSTTVPEVDNPQPEGEVDLEKCCETSSGLECFSELHKRIAKLEEKLQHTLEKSIEINDRKRQKSGSVQKLFRMVSGVLERSGKSKAVKPDPEKSDTEDELRNIKKRLHNLEIKLKRGKNHLARNQLQSTTTNSLLLENGNNEPCETSKIIFKESDYTEPLHSDSELYYPKEYLRKNKKITTEEKTKQVKQTILSKCKKRNLSKRSPKVSDDNQTTEKECFDKEVVLVNFNNLKVHCEGDSNPGWKRKFKKKRRKNNRNLCKKNSKTNILTEESLNVNENTKKQELVNPWTAHENEKYWGQCTCTQCPYRDLSSSLPFSPESINSSLRPCYEDPKTAKLQKSLYFFKSRQNIKMPVLFEEIIAKPKFLGKVSNSKTPKLSMRFVLTRESKNPLVTLRKLVKKLSQTHSSITKDR